MPEESYGDVDNLYCRYHRHEDEYSCDLDGWAASAEGVDINDAIVEDIQMRSGRVWATLGDAECILDDGLLVCGRE